MATFVGLSASSALHGGSTSLWETAIQRSAPPELHQATHLRVAPGAMLQHKRVLSYPYAQVWPTAIRYLRVDRRYAITDRDEDAGYIMFEFPVDGGRTGSGILELIKTTHPSGRDSVKLLVSTGAGPAHLPSTIIDGLSAKVRSERGQPPPPPPPKKDPDAPPPDSKPPESDGSPPMLPGPIDP